MVCVIANIQKPLGQGNLASLCILYVHNWTKSTLGAGDKEHPRPAPTITKLPK
jgi:hypothetical protein